MAKIYGALEVAQLEWFTQSPDTRPSAASNTYRVIYASDVKQVQVSNGTSWISAGAFLVTYTSGTLPSASANPFLAVWVSDLQQVQVSNGTAWIAVGATSGVKNYFSQNNANPNFETNSVSPWSVCTLTFSGGVPSGAPTLTATQMTIAPTAVTPLAGTYSMLLTKAAANAQYQGFISGALTIDREDTAKVLYGSFSYEVVSGTVDFSGTSTQTYEIWIYNTVSGAWTQPAGYRGMNQSSGQGKVTFSFQTDGSASNNSYRIAVITQQTGTGNIVVEFDSFQLGPSAIILGAVVTDWQSYTPTFTGIVASAQTFWYRRVGDSVQIKGRITASSVSAVEARFSLPSGLTSADSTKINGTLEVAGRGEYSSVSATFFGGYAVLIEPNVTYMTFGVESSTVAPLTKLNGNQLMTASSTFSMFAQLPIQGWSSSVQTSDQTDTRVVAAMYSGQVSGTTSTTAPVRWDTRQIDTHGAVTTGANWKFTAPISGVYRISCCSAINSGTAEYAVYKNGVATTSRLMTVISTSVNSGSSSIFLNAGEYIDVRPLSGSFTNNAATDYNIAIERISGPSAIAATETVAARYNIAAAVSISTTQPVNYATKVIDTHNAVTTGAAWKFTAPVSGIYRVSTSLAMATSTATLTLRKNGTNEVVLGSATTSIYGGGSQSVRLNAGDYIDVVSDTASQNTNAFTLQSISIERVGN